ncbi:hypothetical protein F4775DRAFT_562280 [Biscogniauxia sp. FL1348]|nr:hypothetical protein F4775DRAFT_562280 [Biscogniauxia sp. FL1348]
MFFYAPMPGIEAPLLHRINASLLFHLFFFFSLDACIYNVLRPESFGPGRCCVSTSTFPSNQPRGSRPLVGWKTARLCTSCRTQSDPCIADRRSLATGGGWPSCGLKRM